MPDHARSVIGSYSESWTPEDGGRWRGGVENAVRALQAAGYTTQSQRLWTARQGMRGPRRLRVVDVQTAWPYACKVEAIGVTITSAAV